MFLCEILEAVAGRLFQGTSFTDCLILSSVKNQTMVAVFRRTNGKTLSFHTISNYDGLKQNADSHNILETNLNVNYYLS